MLKKKKLNKKQMENVEENFTNKKIKKMKLKYLIIILILFKGMFILPMQAQDLAPSQQAQGYLDSKNVMVDYTTGRFHYNMPIYTLKSGDFELPVSLNYVAKGVREEDVPGLLGYNWTLNTGGIITRTIRGGIADEISQKGYIYQSFTYPPTAEQVKAVNKRSADGESDIFTASFNRQMVHFVIKKEGNNIIAEPLERTNLKIECEKNINSSFIGGWTITDEDGNKYYFKQKEWSTDIVKEDAISFNGVRGESYVSSWYLNRIEPRNCQPITYNYKMKKYFNYDQTDEINVTKYASLYESIYHYGSFMTSRPFNFSKYQSSFYKYISQAKSYLGSFSLEMELDNSLYNFINGNYVLNPNFKVIAQYIDANLRVMGQLTDLTQISEASSNVISNLNQLIDIYSNVGSQIAYQAVICFRNAKSTMIQCLDEIERINTQRVTNGCLMTIETPLLDNIICDGKKVQFNYQFEHSDNKYILENLSIEDFVNKRIFGVQLQLDLSWKFLKQLIFIDKDSVEFNRIKFDYYGSTGPYDYIFDIWGFPKKDQPDISDYNFFPNIDAEYSKIKSISKITNTANGEIHIDYEPNMIQDTYDPIKSSNPFGGIRIKSIIIKDILTNGVDTINYNYPYPGELVYRRSYNDEIVNYTHFKDSIRNSRAKNEGYSFLNTGNNGVYYNYIEEEFVNKGKKTYLFFNPNRFLLPTGASYKFWLNSLPLGSAVYDKNGNLKEITKNYYQVEVDPADYYRTNQIIREVYYKGNWFISPYSLTTYTRNKPQIKAYEYYMDAEYLSSYYRSQSNVLMYQDGSYTSYINPYNDIFIRNIAPRTNLILPKQGWVLGYGGKVLLKSQEEYRIESDYSTASSIFHYVATNLGKPFNKTEYFYDNTEYTISPTRINKTDAQGEVYTSVIKRICNMNITGIITEMKAENIVSPIVKEQSIKNNKLLSETVNIYGSSNVNNKKYFGMTEQKTFIPANDRTITSFASVDDCLYSYPEQNYTMKKTINYINDNSRYLPVSISEKKDTLSYSYGHTISTPILKAKNYTNSSIAALNLVTYSLNFKEFNISAIENYYDNFTSLYNLINRIEQQDLSLAELEYINTLRYSSTKKAIEAIVTKGQSIEYVDFKEYADSITINSQWGNDIMAFCYPHTNSLDEYYGVYNSINFLSNSSFFTESFYLTLQTIDIIRKERSMNISSVSNSDLKFYLLSKSCKEPIKCTITHSKGTSILAFTPVIKPYWNIQTFSADFSLYEGISSVEISRPAFSNTIAYMALVPKDCEFEATAYSIDGTILCKFNQNGQMERNEYDGAGRIIRVFDQNNRIIKENVYNVIIQ